MPTRPRRYPLHDTSGTNSAALPDIYTLLGYPPFSVADPRSVNAKLGSNGGWVQYNDQTLVRAEDVHNDSVAYRLSVQHFGYATGVGLGPLNPTTTPVYIVRGSMYRFDAAFTTDAGLQPIVFEASRKTWIYCDPAGVVRVDVVALATPSAPIGSEFVVVGIETDATDVVANDTGDSPEYQLHFTGPDVFFDTTVKVIDFGAINIVCESLITGGNVTTDYSIDVVATTGATSMRVTGNNVQAAAIVAGGTGLGLSVTSSGATAPALYAEQGDAQPAIEAVNSGTGDAITGTSDVTSGAGLRGRTGNIVNPGVLGESAALAGSVAVEAKAQDVAAFGLVARSFAGANSGVAAALALAFGDATALRGLAVNGYGAVVESDTTAPTRSALRMVPQNADPTTSSQGDVRVASERGGVIRHYDGTQHRSVHSTPKGYVFACGATVAGGAGNTGNISPCTITPEQVGDVLVAATLSVVFTSDASNITLTLIDVTNASAIIATQLETAHYYNGGGAVDNTRSVSISVRYTLPSAVARTFAVAYTVGAGATVSYSGATCRVHGLL